MKISVAILRLQDVMAKHGDVEIYFDCPKCELAFTPTVVVTKAVVMHGDPK